MYVFSVLRYEIREPRRFVIFFINFTFNEPQGNFFGTLCIPLRGKASYTDATLYAKSISGWCKKAAHWS